MPDFVEPLVRKAAFLLAPTAAFLCLRMIFNFFVLDATYYLILEIKSNKLSIKKEFLSQLSAYSLNYQQHLHYKNNEAQIVDQQSLNLHLRSSFWLHYYFDSQNAK